MNWSRSASFGGFRLTYFFDCFPGSSWFQKQEFPVAPLSELQLPATLRKIPKMLSDCVRSRSSAGTFGRFRYQGLWKSTAGRGTRLRQLGSNRNLCRSQGSTFESTRPLKGRRSRTLRRECRRRQHWTSLILLLHSTIPSKRSTLSFK